MRFIYSATTADNRWLHLRILLQLRLCSAHLNRRRMTDTFIDGPNRPTRKRPCRIMSAFSFLPLLVLRLQFNYGVHLWNSSRVYCALQAPTVDGDCAASPFVSPLFLLSKTWNWSLRCWIWISVTLDKRLSFIYINTLFTLSLYSQLCTW